MTAIELLREARNTLNFDLNVLDVNAGLFTVEHLKSSRVNAIVTIDEIDYIITYLDKRNNTFQVNDNNINAIPNKIALKVPYFNHGTAMMQNNEWVQAQFDEQKFPCIYVREVLKEIEFTENSGSSLEREADVVLYIVDSVNADEWTTTDHYNEVVPALEYIKNEYKNAILNHKQTGKIENFDKTTRVNFGVYTTLKGNTEAVFNDRLTAIELGFTLPIYINFKTNCK